MKKVNDISMPLGSSEDEVKDKAFKKAGLPRNLRAEIARKSIDARRSEIREIYSVKIFDENERETEFYSPEKIKKTPKSDIYIVGFGPAGIFAAYLLCLAGFKPTIVERGRIIEERARSVEIFRNGGKLDENSNVRFGEGGAGTFSDGKLTTRINDPRCGYVLKTLAYHGAPDEILSQARPHIGTDILRDVIEDMRQSITDAGCEILYNTKMTDVEIRDGRVRAIYLNGERNPAENIIVAPGNGAEDTYEMLLNNGVIAEPKPFSVGFRMEFKQEDLNDALYGASSGNRFLPPAEYNFFTHLNGDKNDTVYSFCMCPGGYVVNASAEEGLLVTNGMSYHSRNGLNANSALLASVSFDTPEDGITFQRMLESRAYNVAKGYAPISLAKDFLAGKKTVAIGGVHPTFAPGVICADLYSIYPEKLSKRLAEGLAEFQKKVFKCDDAVLTGVETRTSAPLRLTRDKYSFEALGISGLYPCGEGSGYSGGIVSSATDGLRTAEALIKKLTGTDIKTTEPIRI